ncbi:FAD/NAD(P)-binding domain-containing protein [Auricularia subglabra TFB-10046 SS5]|nr:FAD/NAD(P)-binding domain-containing protein [Auricularia subglabra TFB-10046 SS5]
MSSQSHAAQPLRIAIVGGGVGGLCLAGTIAKFEGGDREVVLYEAASDFSDVGAGLSIYGRSFDIVSHLGLEDDIAAINTAMGSDGQVQFTLRRSDRGPEGYIFSTTTVGGRGGVFHRAELRSVFARNCERSKKVEIHFNKRLSSFSKSPRPDTQYTLSFADGTSATCDVLIGADGVRSPVRVGMFNTAATSLGDESLRIFGVPVWSGQSVYRTLIPMERATEEWNKLGGEGKHPLMTGRYSYSGTNKKIIAYAIQNYAMANVAAFVREGAEEGEAFPDEKWVRDVETAQIRKEFEGWENGAVALTNAMTKASRWAIHVAHKLPFFAHGNVAVIGDAAHAMTPHNASGANQALEDAYILGRLLAHPSTTHETAHLALKAYDRVRRPRAQEIVEISRDQGRLTDFTAPEGDNETAIAEKLKANAVRVAEGSTEEDLLAAEDALKQFVAEMKQVSN